MPALLHAPLQSAVDVSFWTELARLKLEELKLSEEPLPIDGFLSPSSGVDVAGQLQLTADSFDSSQKTSRNYGSDVAVPGVLVIANTVEAFDAVDRAAFLGEHGARPLVKDVEGGCAIVAPSCLCRFVLHVFVDLKRFIFKYWLAIPALQPAQPASLVSVQTMADLPESIPMLSACTSWVKSDASSTAWLVTRDSGGAGGAQARPLSEWSTLVARGTDVTLAFLDPSSGPYPGWPLRNLIALATKLGTAGRLRVLGARMLAGKLDETRSCIFTVDVAPPVNGFWLKLDGNGAPVVVGWERDLQGQLGPRVVDLRSVLDPRERASQAVALNLQLMAWRLFPELDAAMLAGKRCVCIGAGTLGCAVARTLMGWGVSNLTLVDNGRVSFSNPVRQSLFEYEDALDGGRPKAVAAAERLARISPLAKATGVCLTVPMPGHAPAPDEEASILDDVNKLDALVAEADCIFLLTDTRESRWLITMLCAHHNKLLVNAALGFDSYLVMRHGCRPRGQPSPSDGFPHLGCYFCGDCTAGVNDSTANRSMDQQCTVTRPGLAPIAAALAVELAVSLWHHPEGAHAPAGSMSPLGECPHQIRGALLRYEQRCFTGAAFSQCIACSSRVLEAYRGPGRDAFLLSVFKDGKTLDRISGLDSLFNASIEGDWDEDDSE